MPFYRKRDIVEAVVFKLDGSNVKDIYLMINGTKFWTKYVKTQQDELFLKQEAIEHGLPFILRETKRQARIYPGEVLYRGFNGLEKTTLQLFDEEYELITGEE